MLDAFDPPYMQRALLEAAMLAVLAGTVGSWIVLRRLAFFTHAVGTGSFPGLVVAGPWGVAPQLAALATALGMAAGVRALQNRRELSTDAVTGLLLVAALAAGIVLASDVYEAGAGVDRLLFGTLLGVTDLDLLVTGAAVVVALAANAALRRSWLAAGFDPETARALGTRPVAGDLALLAVVAACVVVALDAAGALLVASVLVVPAATARLLADDLGRLQLLAAGLALVELVAALAAARELNVGPGPAVAVLATLVFAGVRLAQPGRAA